MSHSTIWKVYKTTTTSYRELKNGHGSAPPVLDWLCDRYWNHRSWISEDNLSKLWEMYKDVNIPEHIRFGLLVTFDDGIVEVGDLKKASELALRVYDTTYDPRYVNHWKAISESYRELSTIRDKRLWGIALGCTSVCDPWEDRNRREPFSVFSILERSRES